ncbi:MAG: desulfoferrodoxin [Bacteroidales bacterium]|nr:desulfoferrodoxin [Bacteroidales bacterium]
MTKRGQIYKCEKCGQIVEVMDGGAHPVCCGDKMTFMEEQTADSSVEKHVPVIEKIDGGYRVYVGSTEHPMVDAHYVEWIQLIVGDEVHTKFLKPGEKPEAIFKTDATGAVSAREYCNIHGNWRKDL